MNKEEKNMSMNPGSLVLATAQDTNYNHEKSCQTHFPDRCDIYNYVKFWKHTIPLKGISNKHLL